MQGSKKSVGFRTRVVLSEMQVSPSSANANPSHFHKPSAIETCFGVCAFSNLEANSHHLHHCLLHDASNLWHNSVELQIDTLMNVLQLFRTQIGPECD